MDAASLQPFAPLFAAARRTADKAVLQRAEGLARDGSVSLLREQGEELELAVRAPGWAHPLTVGLFAETQEWACDCGGNADPCPHVVACALALEALRKEGRPLAASKQRSVAVRWELRSRTDGGPLELRRSLLLEDGTALETQGPLPHPKGLPEGVSLECSAADLALDRRLGADGRGTLEGSEKDLARLCGLLSECASRTLDGAAVSASEEPLRPFARVRDAGEGLSFALSPPERFDRVCAPGLGVAGGALRPLAATDLAGRRWEKLSRTQTIPRAELASLVLLLDKLGDAVELVERSSRLPRLRRGLAPRVDFDLVHAPGALTVIPRIVYGDPPQLRLDGDRAEYLQGDVPARDAAAEVDLGHALLDKLNLVPGKPARFLGASVHDFTRRLRSWARSESERSRHFGEVPLRATVEVQGNRLEVSFAEQGAEGAKARTADAAAVLQSWSDGLDVVALEGGGFAPLPLEWLKKHGELVRDLLSARRDEDHTLAPAALPDLGRLCAALELPAPPEARRLASLLEGLGEVPPAELPGDLTAELRPYQRRGVDWLCMLRDAGLGAILADDMGLGKTLQALCSVRGRALVVCPRSVVHNWVAEAQRFRPGLRCAVYQGPERSLDPEAALTVCTYGVLRLDAEKLGAVAWDVVLLDEAQALKNPESQTARAAYSLRASFRVALSGTPVENRLEELWSLMHFCNRGLLGGRSAFAERYADPLHAGDAEAARRLRARLAPFVLRRLKREVAPELPPRTDAVLYCELDERERATYDSVRAAAQKELAALAGVEVDPLGALEALLRLRQAACHPGLLPGHTEQSSSKVERLLHALEEAAAEGHKALVFSQWTSLLDRVEPALRKAGVRFTRLDGSTRDRAAVVAEFQAEAGPPVMLVSLKAGGTGLNLTAADHVFLLDPWWNPAVEDQAADRAHRIGQQRAVTVYRLVARDTVDERVLALQQRKRSLADAALSGAEPELALTREELRSLLE